MSEPVALALPFEARSASVARQELRDWLQGLDLPDEVVEDSRLVVSELVGNAVRHARPLDDGTMLVSWAHEGPRLDIAVTDGGAPTVPHQVDASTSALAGRGLSIVEQLSTRWWLETSRSQSTVHAVLDLADGI